MKKIIPILINILIVPITVLIGFYFLDDRKYYFISLLIILETLCAFFYRFENKKVKLNELITIAVFCAIAVAGRIAFYMIPSVKPMIAVVIISGIVFGKNTGFLVGTISAFVSNIYFGQGPWTPWQMLASGVMGFLAGILFHNNKFKDNPIILCLFAFLGTLIFYGGIMNFYSLISYTNTITWKTIQSTYLLGIPYDLTHATSTAIFLLLFANTFMKKLERVKVKYGLGEENCQ